MWIMPTMDAKIPSASEIGASLQRLSHAQLRQLAAGSGVPYPTLCKIRQGFTPNPGIETVRKFMPHLAALATEPTTTQA